MAVTFPTPVEVDLANVTSFNSGTLTVVSGQPIVVTVLDQTLANISIADTFATPYVWTLAVQSGGPGGTHNRVSQYIGTNGIGTSGVVTVTASTAEFMGGVFQPCVGATNATGLAAIDGATGVINSGSGTTATSPSILPSRAGCGLVMGIMNDTLAISGDPTAPWVSTPVSLSGTQFGGTATYSNAPISSSSTSWTMATGAWFTSGLAVLPQGVGLTEVQNVVNVYVDENAMPFVLSNVTAGNVLVLLCCNNINNNFFSSVSGGGATWTQITQITNSSGGAGNFSESEIWVGTGTTGGTVTVTATLNSGGSSFIAGALYELSGTTGAVDVSGTSQGIATPLNGPSLTPSGAGELMLTIVACTDGTTTFTGAPWIGANLTFSGGPFGAVASNPFVTAGNAAQFVVTGGNPGFYAACAVIFLPSATSAGGAPGPNISGVPGDPFAGILQLGAPDGVAKQQTGPVQHTQSLSATLSFAGSAIKRTAFILGAVLSFAGALTKRTGVVLTAAILSFAGSLAKKTAKSLFASLTFAGSALIKRTINSLTAGLTFAGLSLTKRTVHTLLSTVSFSGSLVTSAAQIFFQTFVALLSLGSINQQYGGYGNAPYGGITYGGGTSLLNNLIKQTQIPISGTVQSLGSLTKRTGRVFSNSVLLFAGALSNARQHFLALTATLPFTGSIAKRTLRAFSGTASFAASFAKQTGILFSAALSFAASLSRRIKITISAVVSFSGLVFRTTSAQLVSAVLSFAGSLSTSLRVIIFQILSALLSFGNETYDGLLASYEPSAWWKLADPVSSTTAVDSSGNGWTASATNVIFGEPGIIPGNTSVHTDGSTSQITSTFNPSGSGFTVIAWINPDSDFGGGVVVANSHTDADNNGFYLVGIGGGGGIGLVFGNGSTFATAPGPDAPTGVWTMLVGTYDGSTVSFYENASLESAVPLAGSLSMGTTDLGIGWWPSFAPNFAAFPGLIAEVAILDVALSQSEIAALYGSASGSGGGPSLFKQTQVPSNASLSFAGSITKRITAALAGVLSFVGNLTSSSSQVIQQMLSAVLSFSTNGFIKQTQILLNGSLSFAGTLMAQLSGMFFQALSATLSMAGNLNKQSRKSTTATLSFIGNFGKQPIKVITSTLSFASTITKQTQKVLPAILTTQGALNRNVSTLISGILLFTGNLAKTTSRSFTSTLTFSSLFVKQTQVAIAATLSTSATMAKRIGHQVIATCITTAILTKSTLRKLSGSTLQFVEQLKHVRSVVLSAILTFTTQFQARHLFARVVEFTAGAPKAAWSAAGSACSWVAGAPLAATWSAAGAACSWVARIVKASWSSDPE